MSFVCSFWQRVNGYPGDQYRVVVNAWHDRTEVAVYYFSHVIGYRWLAERTAAIVHALGAVQRSQETSDADELLRQVLRDTIQDVIISWKEKSYAVDQVEHRQDQEQEDPA